MPVPGIPNLSVTDEQISQVTRPPVSALVEPFVSDEELGLLETPSLDMINTDIVSGVDEEE